MNKLPFPKLSHGMALSRKNLENEASGRAYGVHGPVSSAPLGEQLGDHPFRNGEAMLKDLKGDGWKAARSP